MGKDWLELPERWKRQLTMALRPRAQMGINVRKTASNNHDDVDEEGGGGEGGFTGGGLGAGDSIVEEEAARADGHGFGFVVARVEGESYLSKGGFCGGRRGIR